MAKMKFDGAVELYHDNTKHFETTSTGVLISSRLSTDNTGAFMTLSDSSPYGFIIEQSASRNITIRTDGDNINLNQKTNGEYYLRCIKDAEVRLYHNGSQKFETTSSGNKTTGNLLFSGGTGAVNTICNANNNSIDICGSEYIYFRTNTTTERMRVGHFRAFVYCYYRRQFMEQY